MLHKVTQTSFTYATFAASEEYDKRLEQSAEVTILAVGS